MKIPLKRDYPRLIMLTLLIASLSMIQGCANNNQGNQQSSPLARTISNDKNLEQVLVDAKALIKSGFAAGDGYNEVWIRDFATFIELATEVQDHQTIKDNLLLFFRFQGTDGNIVDGYVPAEKTTGGYEYIRKDSIPNYAAHKNTVETDQETSLIHAVYYYIKKTGDTAFLNEVVDGHSVLERMGFALEFLNNHRLAQQYGLLWGATTADWGDVQPEHNWGVVLDNNSHRTIDIYDNAMYLIAMDHYMALLPIDADKQHWAQRYQATKKAARQHLWDSKNNKFIPHIYLEGSPFPADFDENAIYYHGGTAVAIQAGLLSKDEVAQALAKMVDNVERSGAPSIGLTLYPTYPTGYFKNKNMGAYSYQNGGDWTWFGARMIQQLIRYGYVEEAYREIQPMTNRVLKNEGFYEWYRKDGTATGSGSFRGSAGVLGKAIEMLMQWAEENSPGRV
jgi:cellobiose phosphorylase